MPVHPMMYVHVMLLFSGKDRVLEYVIIIMNYCPSWTPLYCTRSDHGSTTYMYIVHDVYKFYDKAHEDCLRCAHP